MNIITSKRFYIIVYFRVLEQTYLNIILFKVSFEAGMPWRLVSVQEAIAVNSQTGYLIIVSSEI